MNDVLKLTENVIRSCLPQLFVLISYRSFIKGWISVENGICDRRQLMRIAEQNHRFAPEIKIVRKTVP